MSTTINVKREKRCITCKLWHGAGESIIDYNAKTCMLRFNDTTKARCDFWKTDRQAIHWCPKHQIEYRYL